MSPIARLNELAAEILERQNQWNDRVQVELTRLTNASSEALSALQTLQAMVAEMAPWRDAIATELERLEIESN
jgi:hypothetical protein